MSLCYSAESNLIGKLSQKQLSIIYFVAITTSRRAPAVCEETRAPASQSWIQTTHLTQRLCFPFGFKNMFLISCCGLKNPPGGASKCQRKFMGWKAAWGPLGSWGFVLCCRAVGGRQRGSRPCGRSRPWVGQALLCQPFQLPHHLSDGFINIRCSFLLRHTACSLPGKQDCLAISQKRTLRT